MAKKRATNAVAKSKRSVLERLKGNSKPSSKLLKDMTPEEQTSLLAGIVDQRRELFREVEQAAKSGMQSANEFLAAKGLPNGDIDSVLRAGRIVGIPVGDILDMNLGELIDEAEIIDARESWKAQKVAEALQRSETTSPTRDRGVSPVTLDGHPQIVLGSGGDKKTIALKPKSRRSTRRCATRDSQFVVWNDTGLSAKEIAAKWNRENDDDVSEGNVRKILSRSQV